MGPRGAFAWLLKLCFLAHITITSMAEAESDAKPQDQPGPAAQHTVHISARSNQSAGAIHVHVHPHPDPLPALNPENHAVHRALPAGSDFAGDNRTSWVPLPPFYQPYWTSRNAVRIVETMGTEPYWRRWKQHVLDLLAGGAQLAAEGRGTTSGETCKTTQDCEGRCRKRCLLERVRLECLSGPCGGSCERHPGSCDRHGRHCKYSCSSDCLSKCVEGRLYKLKNDRLNSCMPKQLKQCRSTCVAVLKARSDRPKDFLACHSRCVSEAVDDCIAPLAGPCGTRCGRHVCLRGRCTCPGLLSGDDECTEPPAEAAAGLPDISRDCFQTFQEPRFLQGKTEALPPAGAKPGAKAAASKAAAPSPVPLLGERTRSTMETLSQYLWWSSGGHGKGAAGITAATSLLPDLKDMADWSSCAIIGSSGSLTEDGNGAIIDSSHTAWIRFNDAPTVGYERSVGSRTTIRIQNNLYCGFNEGKEEMCSPYTKFSTRAKCHPTEGRSCPMMLFSDPVHEAVKSFMRPEFYHSPLVDVNDFHWNTTGHVDTSAGFFGALLALHLCGEVRIYGFDQHPTHYYNKKPSATIKPFETRHGWDAERHCLAAYEQALPNFRIVRREDYKEQGGENSSAGETLSGLLENTPEAV